MSNTTAPSNSGFDLFNPTEEHTMLRQMVADFTKAEVEPQAEEFDTKECMNIPLFQQLGELGLLGITVPEEWGGAGMDTTAVVIVHSTECITNQNCLFFEFFLQFLHNCRYIGRWELLVLHEVECVLVCLD